MKERAKQQVNLANFGEQSFHFGAGMLIAGANGGLNALGENGFCFVEAIVLSQVLRVHLVTGNIVRIGFKKRAEMRFGGGEVSKVDAFESESIEGERIVGMFGEEFLEHLAASFLLFGHGGVSYYTWGAERNQR